MFSPRLYKRLRGKKFRFLTYFLFCSISALYLIGYIDSIRFFNLKKACFSLKGSVELADFKQTFNLVSYDNGLGAKLELVDDKPYLVLDGFTKELLTKENSQILKRNVLHPSLRLALFSLGYASDFFVTNLENRNLGSHEVDILEDIYLLVYNEIINPFSMNRITVGDHVVSERIQFILLFSTYIKNYFPEKKMLLKALSKDFNICLGFLMDDKFFTWKSNHGLMQLRSLAQTTGVIKNDRIKKSILDIFNKRLIEIIPYFIGPDGAVYEGASGYWVYIYDQFAKIARIEAVSQLSSVSYLNGQLDKITHFLRMVAANDGFLQGLGDSYSRYIPDTLNNIIIPQNRYFNFSNEIAGANWTVDKDNYSILFVSLHTPPNVHKLPEDLAVYLYVNQPVFSNTGSYSYDESEERLLFKTVDSQSTVSLLNNPDKQPVSSDLSLEATLDTENTRKVIGVKQYQDSSKINRLLEIDPENRLFIKDFTVNTDTLIAYYNIHPKIKTKRITDNQMLLQTVDSVKLVFKSNCKIDLTKGIISEKKEEITTIERFKITGNPIEVTILLPVMDLDQTMKVVTNNIEDNIRLICSKSLEQEYSNQKRFDTSAKDLVINKSILFVVLFIILVSSSELINLLLKKRID
jgi:hypothetical protein